MDDDSFVECGRCDGFGCPHCNGSGVVVVEREPVDPWNVHPLANMSNDSAEDDARAAERNAD